VRTVALYLTQQPDASDPIALSQLLFQPDEEAVLELLQVRVAHFLSKRTPKYKTSTRQQYQ